MNRNKRKAFTLVEIMIVVLIIGILLAIAVPNFIKARQSSRLQTVIGNLKQIESAKEQWAMETGQVSSAVPTEADLVPDYMKTWPSGPVNLPYTANAVNVAPQFGTKDAAGWKADPTGL